MSRFDEMNEVFELMESKGITFGELMKNEIGDKCSKFKALTEWSDKDYKEYAILLESAKEVSYKKESETKTKDVGDILESLVTFIIERTYFFDVVKNVRTRTNEIDLYVTRSNVGKQAISQYNLSEELLIIPEKDFIVECKNYDKNIGVTWFGKFYSVMKICDCNFGILFSLKKATGNFDNWSDAYGLIRTLSLVEKYKYGKEFYLIDFGLSDFESIGNGNNFFDIIKNKIIALKIGANYDNFVKGMQRDLDDEKLEKLDELRSKIKSVN